MRRSRVSISRLWSPIWTARSEARQADTFLVDHYFAVKLEGVKGGLTSAQASKKIGWIPHFECGHEHDSWINVFVVLSSFQTSSFYLAARLVGKSSPLSRRSGDLQARAPVLTVRLTREGGGGGPEGGRYWR